MPAYSRSRPAPRRSAGPPKQISDTVTWTRTVDPRERYRIVYQDRDGAQSIREIELTKMGDSQGTAYIGVNHEGKFKTMRMDRVLQVLQQLTTGHPSSLHAAPTYRTALPKFPVDLDGRPERLHLHLSGEAHPQRQGLQSRPARLRLPTHRTRHPRSPVSRKRTRVDARIASLPLGSTQGAHRQSQLMS